MTIQQIAQVVHNIQKAFCMSIGDNSLPNWEDAPSEMHTTVIKGVNDLLNNPDAGAGFSHEKWMANKIADGWVYGEVKDWEKKTHPSLISFDQLPAHEVTKDVLFVETVRSLEKFLF